MKLIKALRNRVGTDGTIWNLPNYDGELFTADQVNTPLLTMIGGLNGGKQTTNFEFPTASLYSIDAAAQPAITETAAISGATAGQAARTQVKNVTQIFMEAISVSYVKLSNQGRLSGINTAGSANSVEDELAFQQMVKLQKIARDVNYTFHNGAYQISTDAGTANKTRGMLAAIVVGGNTIAAAGAALSKTLIDQLLLTMLNAGAVFQNCVIFCAGFQKQQLSKIYGYAPQDRNVGGLNIKQLETDFGNLGVVLDRMMPTDTFAIYEMTYLAPVFQPVPNKGNLFYEALSKTGAAEKGQMYGQIGLDYGPTYMHGSITGLATS